MSFRGNRGGGGGRGEHFKLFTIIYSCFFLPNTNLLDSSQVEALAEVVAEVLEAEDAVVVGEEADSPITDPQSLWV